ncbi:MAG: hypothetical protein ACR2QM_08805, partial [Longimicrobiales bacterium]
MRFDSQGSQAPVGGPGLGDQGAGDQVTADRGEHQEKRVGLGWAAILAPLTLGFGFSLMLAYQAYDAGREHRMAAQAAARDQSAFAAFLLASSVDREMRESLLYGFYPIDLALGRGVDPLPAPEILRVEPEASRCTADYPAGDRRFFRFDPALNQVAVDGERPQALEQWILTNFPADDTEPGIRHTVADLDGRPSLIVYRRWGDSLDHVVYGFESCWRTAGGSVFEQAVQQTQAFSPALVGATPNDSLFVLAARMDDGTLAYGERWAQPAAGAYTGSYY